MVEKSLGGSSSLNIRHLFGDFTQHAIREKKLTGMAAPPKEE
jgi:hypothetical protein